MNKKRVLSIGLIAIFLFISLRGLTTIANNFFAWVNTKMVIENFIVLGFIHSFIGVLVGIAFIPFIRKVMNKEPRPGHIFLFLGLALFIIILEMTLSVLEGFNLLYLSPNTYATHQQYTLVSSSVIAPVVVFIYLLTVVFEKE